MSVFQTEKEALAYMATHEGGRGMAENIILDWKERTHDLEELDQDIAKGIRQGQLLTDMRADLGKRALETYNALEGLEGTKTAMEQANSQLQAENEKLDGTLTKKRENTTQEITTLDRTLKDAKQAHAVALAESNKVCEAALQADKDTILASFQTAARELERHAKQSQEEEAAHAEVLRGYAEAEAEAKLATAEAEQLRARITALRK